MLVPGGNCHWLPPNVNVRLTTK